VRWGPPARQDRKAEGRVPISAKLVANIITAAGATRALAIDLHAAQLQGITGPAGPVGPGGSSGASLTLSRVADAALVDFQLPADAGDATHPPAVTAYLSTNAAGGGWVQVSDAFDAGGPFITLQFTRGAWTVTMRSVPIGSTVIIVVHY